MGVLRCASSDRCRLFSLISSTSLQALGVDCNTGASSSLVATCLIVFLEDLADLSLFRANVSGYTLLLSPSRFCEISISCSVMSSPQVTSIRAQALLL